MTNYEKTSKVENAERNEDLSQERLSLVNSNDTSGAKLAGNGTFSSFPFDSLPHLVFLNILSYFTIKELGEASRVCRLWHSKCFDPSLWRNLNFKGRSKVTDAVLGRITSLSQNISTLNISECAELSEKCIVESLRGCSFLEEIRLVRCSGISDLCLECIGQSCSRLKILDISLCPVTDEGIRKVCG